VRAIYCIRDLAQCWPDLDQCQEQENNGKNRLGYRRDAGGDRDTLHKDVRHGILSSGRSARECGKDVRNADLYSSATGRISFGAEGSDRFLSVSPHYCRRLLAPPEPTIPRNLRLRHPEIGHYCQRRLIDPAVEATG
jgi:hypothetical protein